MWQEGLRSNFNYVGFELNQIHEQITLNQNNYLLDLEPGIMSIAYASHTNYKFNAKEQTSLRELDRAYEMIDLSTKLKSGVVNDLLQAMNVVRNV